MLLAIVVYLVQVPVTVPKASLVLIVKKAVPVSIQSTAIVPLTALATAYNVLANYNGVPIVKASAIVLQIYVIMELMVMEIALWNSQ